MTGYTSYSLIHQIWCWLNFSFIDWLLIDHHYPLILALLCGFWTLSQNSYDELFFIFCIYIYSSPKYMHLGTTVDHNFFAVIIFSCNSRTILRPRKYDAAKIYSGQTHLSVWANMTRNNTQVNEPTVTWERRRNEMDWRAVFPAPHVGRPIRWTMPHHRDVSSWRRL